MTGTPEKTTDQRVADLESKVDGLVSQLAKVDELAKGAEPEFFNNRRERFRNTGNWGRHYSSIRLGGTTFFVGIAIAILKVIWDNPGVDQLRWFAFGTWAVAFVIFFAFTLVTIVTECRERKHRKSLLIQTSTEVHPIFFAIVSHALVILLFAAMTVGYCSAVCFIKERTNSNQKDLEIHKSMPGDSPAAATD